MIRRLLHERNTSNIKGNRPTLDRLRSEGGFALPATIFVLTFMTLMMASAFTRASMEHRLADGSKSTVTALSVAESGLQAFLGDTWTSRPVTGDSVRYNVAGGYAWVFPRELHIPGDSLEGFTYIVESTGYYVDPAHGSDPLAQRTIGQFVDWKLSSQRKSAYVAANRNQLNGGAEATFLISGGDECKPDVNPGEYLDTIPGVLGPWNSDNLPGYQMGTPAELNAGSALDLVQDLGLDWVAIENGDFVPDYTSLAAADGDTTYASYVIDGFQEDINGIQGTGLLIIKNRIESYGFDWDGVVIAGKDMDTQGAGTTRINGMLITGMDIIVGDPDYPTTQFDAASQVEIRFDSCKVERSFRTLRGFVPLENAHIDNWATY